MPSQTQSSSIPPRSIGLVQRIGVFVLRALMAIFKLVSLFRSSPTAPGPVTTHRYGEHPDETLQFIPRKPGSIERAPVVYIHGGGWIAGKKELYTGDLYFLADQGHPVFNLEYPLAPENPHPAILRSLLLALAWVRKHHPEFESAHFMGDSAGGNLATMLGVLSHNPELIRDIDPSATPRTALGCQSIVSLYGVLDRLSWIDNEFPLSKVMLESYGGKAAFEKEVTPDLAITPLDLKFDSVPPCYLVAGTEDPLCESTRLFAERLEGQSNEVVLEIFEGEQHGFFNMSWRPASQEMRRQVLAFLQRHDSSRAAAAESGGH
jgi:acetyl esterase